MFCLKNQSYFSIDIKPYEADLKLIRFFLHYLEIATALLQQGYYGLMALLKSVTIKPSVIKCKIST